MWNVPTAVPGNVTGTFVKVSVEPPSTSGSVVMVAIAGLLLITVTSRRVGGATPKLIWALTCKSSPICAEPGLRLMFGAVTVAVICCRLLGVEKPVGGGAGIASVVVPPLSGSNCTVLGGSVALKATGPPTLG